MGRSIYCGSCKKEKEPGRDNESYCKACKSKMRSLRNARKREEAGKRPWGEGRSLYCYECNKLKENPEISYCHDCTNRRSRERWKNVIAPKVSQRVVNIYCGCGNEKSSSRKIYCEECLKKRRNANDRSRRKVYRNLLVKSGIITDKKPLTHEEKVIRKAARNILQSALKQGRIKRLDCERCGSNINVDAHHDDYTKPLEVIWLCKEHHIEHHKLYPNLEE